MQAPQTSTVIDFPQARVRPPAEGQASGSAQVLIFTGVRIERMFDLAERLPAARSGRSSRIGEADMR